MTSAPANGLFSPWKLGGVSMRCRILRAATDEGMADEKGAPLFALCALYARLAKGGVGGIITGQTAVTAAGRSHFASMLRLDDDRLIPAWQTLARAAHSGGAPLFAQLNHCGRQTRGCVTQLPIVAPSAIRHPVFKESLPAELTTVGIRDVVQCFARAADRAKRAGCDGVQLHAAHGYLLSDFLSPAANARTDEYGGDTDGRCRIVQEIIRAIHERTGKDFPVLVKLNAEDAQPGGMRLGEAMQVAKRLEQYGAAAIEVSCGVGADGLCTVRGERLPLAPAARCMFQYRKLRAFAAPLRVIAPLTRSRYYPVLAYNALSAGFIRECVNVPVIAVGGMHRLCDMQQALSEGKADAVSISRPLIRCPEFVNKLRAGEQTESACCRCNYCVVTLEKAPLRCYNGKWDAKMPERQGKTRDGDSYR